MRVYQILFAASLAACRSDDSERSDALTVCDLGSTVGIQAHPGALQSDGSVTLYGSVLFAPQTEGENAGVNAERAVYAVFVADQEVQPTATDFNFRSWSIMITADRLAAFTTTAMDGSKSARLPVRAHLHGGCVVDVEEAKQPVIAFPMTTP